MGKYSRLIVLLATLHFVTAMACTLGAFTRGMNRFDGAETNKDMMEVLSGIGAEILTAPGRFLWTPWASKNLPDVFEWLLLISNSLLWGFALVLIFTRLSKMLNGKKAGAGAQQ